MSAYVNFFIRNNDNFIPLGSYHKNSDFYTIISDRVNIPWENITNITYDTLIDWNLSADHTISYFEKAINRVEKMFELSNSFTLDDAYEYAGSIEDYEESIEDIKGLKSIFDFMRNILDEYKYCNDNYNVDEILYVGMEIGNPTVDDII